MDTTTTMVDKPESRSSSDGGNGSSEERFRYIGFNVFPSKVPEFWKDEAERKAHVEKVHETHGRFVPLSRSNSLVAARAISATERWMLTVTSALMAISPFLPWFRFTRGSEKLYYSGISLLLNMGPVREYLALGSGLLGASFLLLIVLMLVSSVMGFVSLYFLHAGGGTASEAQLTRLHRIMIWQYLPILGWFAFFVLAMLSTPLPYGMSLGLLEVGNEYGIGALAAAAAAGLWIPFGALWVNAVKGNDL